MALSIFDFDNTLLSGDSDYSWGRFLVDKELVDVEAYEAANRKYLGQYEQGTLDIYEYSSFCFQPLAARTMEELAELHKEFMEIYIEPMIGQKAKDLVQEQRDSATP